MFQMMFRACLAIATIFTTSLGMNANFGEDEEGPPYAIVTGKSLTFGGAHSNISYSGISDRGLPDQLVLDPDQSLSVTAFFVPQPDTDDPGLGSPVTYRWYFWCAEGQDYLTGPVDDYVPGIPGWSPTQGPPWPTLAVQDELTVPEHCREKSFWPGNNVGHFAIQFSGHSGTQYSMEGPVVVPERRAAPEYELDDNGNAVLYTIVDEDEVEEIQETGNWLDSAHNTMRYFFTACEPAREFRDFLISTGGSLGGVATASAPVNALAEQATLAAIEDSAGSNVAVGISRASRGIKSAPNLIKVFEDNPGSSMCDV